MYERWFQVSNIVKFLIVVEIMQRLRHRDSCKQNLGSHFHETIDFELQQSLALLLPTLLQFGLWYSRDEYVSAEISDTDRHICIIRRWGLPAGPTHLLRLTQKWWQYLSQISHWVPQLRCWLRGACCSHSLTVKPLRVAGSLRLFHFHFQSLLL